MNIYEIADKARKIAEAKSKGKGSTSPDKIKLPYVQGNMRKSGKITTAFYISYISCLTACIVQSENASIVVFNKTAKKADKKTLVECSIYLIEAVFAYEGFTLSDYANKNSSGHKRIKAHLVAVAKREELNISVNEQGVVTGLTSKIVDAVLSAV